MDSIAVSARNADIAASLAKLHSKIHVYEQNQRVVNAAEMVCIAVIPQIACDLLQD